MNPLQGPRSIRSVLITFGLASSLFPVCAGVVVVVTVGHAPDLSAQNFGAAPRVVQGRVFASSGEIQSGAVVYLKDEKTLEIKTYISTADGAYRFGQVGSQDDYQLWAEFGGHKSKTKTISSFNAKKVFDVFLHIDDK